MPSTPLNSLMPVHRAGRAKASAGRNSEGRGPPDRSQDFIGELASVLPALMGYARSLTRHREDAEDLFQDGVVRLLASSESFVPGTCFRAWAFTILRNRFLSDCVVRRRRFVSLEAEERPEPCVGASQSHRMEVLDLGRQFESLSAAARRMLILGSAGGAPYKAIALADGCALGTVKSRVHRARALLRERIAADVH